MQRNILDRLAIVVVEIRLAMLRPRCSSFTMLSLKFLCSIPVVSRTILVLTADYTSIVALEEITYMTSILVVAAWFLRSEMMIPAC
jgi:hypothetical protein